MTNLVRRNNDSQTSVRSTAGTWDPFRIMESMLKWDPHTSALPSVHTADVFVPNFDVKETKDGYIFAADLPGVAEQDVDVSLTGNRLSISGKRETEARQESEQYYLYERAWGSFSRSFTLPDGIDTEKVSAHFKDGVLTVTVGKLPQAQPRRIEISARSKTTA